jgi:lipopolysaccharide export system permease protein
MSRLISRYLCAIILLRYFFFTATALLIASLVLILENRDGLMDQEGLAPAAMVEFAVLSTPATFSLLAGFIALLAVLVACMALLRHSELKVILASGLGYGQLLLALAPAALVMAGFHLLMDNAVLPAAAERLRAWDAANGRDHGAALWLRQGQDILRVGAVNRSGDALEDVELFHLNERGALVERIAGPGARLAEGTLTFPEASITAAGSRLSLQRHGLSVPAPLDPRSLPALALHPRDASMWSIAHILRRSTATAWPPQVYRLWLQKKLAGPLMTALAVLLLAPLVQYAHRAGSGRLLLVGLGAGFLYFVADGLLAALAQAGAVRPAAAAWGLPLLVSTLFLLPFAEHRRR